MKRWDLGGNFTPGGDSCAAYQVHLDIPAGETCEVVFVLGEATNTADVKTLAAHWSDLATVADAFEDLSSFWKTNLSAVQVNTPDTAFDLMVNQWLPYQNLASRIMARAGFYQAGGAFGYRDQLQDMLALLYAAPDRVRRHILLAAESQFEAGDALHWWHPPAGKGVRTRCSDDYLWLPYVTSRYVEATGDSSILDVEVPYLRGPELRPEEHDRYARFDQGETATLYDHCMRALDRMMVTGQHDLPLIGTGDWNDGMDRVGDEGRGESVWLAWFQISVISRFSQIAEPRGEPHAVARWRDYSARLRAAAEEVAWDGSWFKRAFDDDGEPWGSSSNEECQIDSIAQSWSVLSDAASKGHQITATASAAARLIDDTNRLVKLLDPPFHNSQRDPGYIQAYPVGVRENGGQYTHAAAWLGFSFAKLGDGDMAWHIFDTINPIRRVSNKQEAALYRREPYVLAGDVSGGERKGQGGWSWYTGAAGWTWQLGVEGILGVSLKDDHIVLDPSIPLNWGKASIVLETKRGCISIDIRDPDRVGSGILSIKVDGQQIDGNRIGFPGPGKSCSAIVILGKREEDAV
jgi:cyclic beta-1,2-glucan synthetase